MLPFHTNIQAKLKRSVWLKSRRVGMSWRQTTIRQPYPAQKHASTIWTNRP